MRKRISLFFYKVLLSLVRFFYPQITVSGAENLSSEPTILVANHSQLHGPVICELYLPVPRFTWCTAEMMDPNMIPDYSFQTFWSQKPKGVRWFYRLLSYAITPLAVCIFNHANTIPVYRDTGLLTTFKQTVSTLMDGYSVVIFPECDEHHNNVVNAFHDHFVDLAKAYRRKTGRELTFTPLYLAPNLERACIGRPVCFSSQAPLERERERICDYLMEEITQMALELPLHRVVPFHNLPKEEYPLNVSDDTKAPVGQETRMIL